MHCNSKQLGNAYKGRSFINSGDLMEVWFQASDESKRKMQLRRN